MKQEIKKQLEYIQSLWFVIYDEKKISWYLEQVWLHRLSRYFVNFKNKQEIDFQEVINHYLFDKSLRSLNLSILEVIENCLKTLFILHFWDYYDDKNIYAEQYRESIIWFIKEKTLLFRERDPEIKKIQMNQKIPAALFIDKLTFWEVVKLFRDLEKKNKYFFVDYFWIIDVHLLENWLFCLKYLRNLCSHWENIFNKKMVEKIRWREVSQFFQRESNNTYISYFFILSVFKDILIQNYRWEEKIFSKILQYNIESELFFWVKKEAFHSVLQWEAWKDLVSPLYKKYVKKSRKTSRKLPENFQKTWSSFSMILAVDSQGWIWKANTLPWRLSQDMKYFKKTTALTENPDDINVVIMGRKTWESIPLKFRPLPGRINCILTRDQNFQDDWCAIFHSYDSCLDHIAKMKNIWEVFVIWGAQIYNQILQDSCLEKIYITRVKWDFWCDVFFDGIPRDFTQESCSESINEWWIEYQFEVWRRG